MQEIVISSEVALAATPEVTIEPAVPARLLVPSIGVDVAVDPVGITARETMAVSANARHVGWYRLGARPGEPGAAVFGGHVDNALGLPGIFYDLRRLTAGDEIVTVDALGRRLVFRVIDSRRYRHDDPVARQVVFAQYAEPQVVLVTCSGTWDQATRMYDERLVVRAVLSHLLLPEP